MNSLKWLLICSTLLFSTSAWSQSSENNNKRFNIAWGFKKYPVVVDSFQSRSLLAQAPIYSVSVGLLGNVERLQGMQLGILSAIVDGEMRGVNMGGLLAYSNGDVKGVQISSLANITRGEVCGVQLSALVNVASGLQGAQVGLYNFVDELRGTQIGLLNVARHHPSGWQVGIINYTQDTIAHKIGLVNVNPKTNIDVMMGVGNTSIVTFALRFRNRSTYNMLGVGSHYLGVDDKFSGALYYRIGQYFHLSRRLSVSGDVGYYHIESFEENARTNPQRLYSLQVHFNIDYQLKRNLGVFLSTGYGNTRHYGSHHLYKNQFLLEGGIALRYNKHRDRMKERGDVKW